MLLFLKIHKGDHPRINFDFKVAEPYGGGFNHKIAVLDNRSNEFPITYTYDIYHHVWRFCSIGFLENVTLHELSVKIAFGERPIHISAVHQISRSEFICRWKNSKDICFIFCVVQDWCEHDSHSKFELSRTCLDLVALVNVFISFNVGFQNIFFIKRVNSNTPRCIIVIQNGNPRLPDVFFVFCGYGLSKKCQSHWKVQFWY